MNNIQYNIRANPDSFPVAHSNWYPPVAVLEKNQQYAQILMADLASTASEMTTVHQYLYQSWTINDHVPPFPVNVIRGSMIIIKTYAVSFNA